MIKRLTAMLAALILATAAFTSCSSSDPSGSSSSADQNASVSDGSSDTDNSDDSSSQAVTSLPEPSLTIGEEKIDTKDIVMCTVAGHDIDFDMYRYYYYFVVRMLSQNYGIPYETLLSSDEEFDFLKSCIMEKIKNDCVAYVLAEEHGIELDEEDQKTVDEKIAEFQKEYGSEENFNIALKSEFIPPEVYRRLLEYSLLCSKIETDLLAAGGKLATPVDEFKTIIQDPEKYSRVVHILIPYYSQATITDAKTKAEYDSYSLYQKGQAKELAYKALSEDEKNKVKEASKKIADEVLEKAKNGDDFVQLIKEYGWDPGMELEPTGYYVNENTGFVQEFKDMCFQLKIDEISGLVENDSYGWFIIKRLPIDMEYVDKNIDTLLAEYDEPKYSKLYDDITGKMEVKESEYITKMKSGDLS